MNTNHFIGYLSMMMPATGQINRIFGLWKRISGMIDDVFIEKKSVMILRERPTTVFSSISQPLIGFWGASASQVKDIYEAYTSLWSSTPSEAHARDIYDSLVAIALADDIHCPINWLSTELRFEAFAAATGDRKWAALMDLTYGQKVKNDKALDLYNERLTREL